MIWCSHLLKNFPQFVVIHTVKGFSIVNEAKVDIFLEFSCLFYDPTMLAIWFFVSIYISLSCQDLYHIGILICISVSVSIGRPYLYLHIYTVAPAASVWHPQLPTHLYLHPYPHLYLYLHLHRQYHYKLHSHKSYGQGKRCWFPLNNWLFKSSFPPSQYWLQEKEDPLESWDFFDKKSCSSQLPVVLAPALQPQVYLGGVSECADISPVGQDKPRLQPGAVHPEEPTALTAPH